MLVRAIVALLAVVTSLATSAAEAPKPNIIVLLCDDLGYGDLACFNNPITKTPNLDQLAGSGVKLTRYYSPMPVCSPSRAGLMTGRNPNRLGIHDWIPQNSGIFLRPGEVTIPQLLKKAGYKTCHVGKWHLNSKVNGSEPTPGDAGFDHWMYTQNNAAPSHLNPTNFVRNGKPVGPTQGPSSHVCVAEATQWLGTLKEGEPFFLNVWFHETHEPVAATPEFLEQYAKEENSDKRHYYGNVSQMDAAVGKLLKYLDAKGLRDNTFIVFTSDNGPETLNRYKNANRSYGSPGPLRGMKLHITEAGYRVPGIMSWPKRITPGQVSETPVCSVDLLPTFCAIAGVDAPKDRALDGANILPMFEGKSITRPHPLYWQYNFSIGRPWEVALLDGNWKLLADKKLEQFALYNLSEDTAEAKDLSAAEPERTKAMAAQMKSLHAEINAEGAKSGNPAPRQQKKE
ncbi:sulfatase-like hydrolase/transferase [Humisphaera borealis]|uniref:Sulfatase-like hydrolase/transferase n=2 Tax=Humisphaera borealis TaxID=2807512 RepID=A0A7M2X6R4_9BACT|nr:sulfatase-like hydrolase/transferase [Humisphaera borealis]